jgi:CRP-like cAMP-binding protein
MTLDNLYTNIEKHIHLTQDDKARFLSALKTKSVKKKSFLLYENQVSTHATFVISGCLKAYTVDDNGFEHIIQFATADWWVTDMYSFITQRPGNIIIEAIENSEVVQLSRADQLRVCLNFYCLIINIL